MNLADPTTNQLIGAFAGALLVAAIWGIKTSLDKGKPLVITVPGTLGSFIDARRRKLTEGVFTRKAGDERNAFVLDGRTAYPSNIGPIHFVTDYGANLIAPSKDEVAEEVEREDGPKTAERFRVFDPLIYWRATKENDTEDYYAAQQGKPHWMEKVAPLLLIAVVALVGLVGFMLWKVLPIISGIGG